MNSQEALQYHQEQKVGSDTYAQKLSFSLQQALDTFLFGRTHEGLQGKRCIATVGFTHVGKTTVANGLQEKIPGLVKVETNKIHDIINPQFAELQDDNTVTGSGYWLREAVTADLKQDVMMQLCQDKWWIIDDDANLQKTDRSIIFDIPRRFDYKTALLWLNIPEKIFLERLREADEETMSRGNTPPWVDLYERIQKPRFQKPIPDESDLLLVFGKNKGIVNKTMKALQQNAS